MSLRRLYPLACAPCVLAACGDSATGAGAGREVAIRFGTTAPQASGAGSAAPAAGQLVVDGDNGVLKLTGFRVIVAEFEVKGDDDVNPCDRLGVGEDCEDFNAGPMLVDVPLGGSPVTVSTGEIPPGSYREVEFEVEDLDEDEDNPAERPRIEALFQQVRAQFSDWPRDASALVTGTFTPRVNGQLGTPRPFRVFIEAEIEVEVELSPPLVIDDASQTRSVSIELDPAALFRLGGNVIDLSQLNGRLLELELEIEHGFSGHGG